MFIGSKNNYVFTTDFFVCKNLLNIRCRSPSNQSIKKFLIDWRNKVGKT
jgi:hypothetical protein